MYVPAHEDSPSAIGLEFSENDGFIKEKKKIYRKNFIIELKHKKISTNPLI